jgi:hypothetical protein
MEPTCGSHLAVRYREEVGGWAGLAAGPVLLRVGLVGCCLSLFSFFLCYFFSL